MRTAGSSDLFNDPSRLKTPTSYPGRTPDVLYGMSTLRTIDKTLEAGGRAAQTASGTRSNYRGPHESRRSVRAAATCRLDQALCSGPRCLLDIFPAGDRAPVPVLYSWRLLAGARQIAMCRSSPSRFQNAGLTVVIPALRSGSAQFDVRRGSSIRCARRSTGGSSKRWRPRRIVVAGHSAGGQLAAMLALGQAARGGGPYRRPRRHQRRIRSAAAVTRPRSISISCCRRGRQQKSVPCCASKRCRRMFRSCRSSALSAAMKRRGSSCGPRILSPPGAPAARRQNSRKSPAETHFTILDALAEPGGDLLRSIRALAHGPVL